jgi:hypothetical protein
MQSEPGTCPVERVRERVGRERRHRVVARADAVERVDSRRAGDADLPLRLRVVGFEVVVPVGPVGELLVLAASRGDAEVIGVQAEE